VVAYEKAWHMLMVTNNVVVIILNVFLMRFVYVQVKEPLALTLRIALNLIKKCMLFFYLDRVAAYKSGRDCL